MGVWSQLELESLSKNKPPKQTKWYQMSCPEKIPNHQHCTTHTSIQQSSWVLGILRSLLQHKPATPQLSCSCVTASTHTMRALCHSLDCIVPHGCCYQCRPGSSCLAAQWLCEEGPHRGDRDSIKNRKGQFNSSQVQHHLTDTLPQSAKALQMPEFPGNWLLPNYRDCNSMVILEKHSLPLRNNIHRIFFGGVGVGGVLRCIQYLGTRAQVSNHFQASYANPDFYFLV